MQNIWINPEQPRTRAATAVFADRDGTLIRHVDYLSDPGQVELLPGVKESVHELLKHQVPFFILTNQSGVGRGYFPIDRVHACQQRLFELLELKPEQIAGWCIAPEAPGTTGGYRKPSPRFILEACESLEITPGSCHIIGDTKVDLETAWASGAKGWAVKCGKPELVQMIEADTIRERFNLRDSFPACVHEILQQNGNER